MSLGRAVKAFMAAAEADADEKHAQGAHATDYVILEDKDGSRFTVHLYFDRVSVKPPHWQLNSMRTVRP